MLDRKTDDFDASVELLKDRKKDNEILFAVVIFVATSITIIGAVFELITLCTLGLALLVISLCYVMNNYNYKLLIQNRRILDGQRDNASLLVDVLDELESFKKCNKKVKDKKENKK